MREYSMPALVQIPATANLADVVFRRAAEQPQAVVLRRPSGDSGGSGAYAGFGDWTDVKHGNNGSTKEPIPFEIVTSTNIVTRLQLHRDHRALRASPFSPHDSPDRAILAGSIMTAV